MTPSEDPLRVDSTTYLYIDYTIQNQWMAYTWFIMELPKRNINYEGYCPGDYSGPCEPLPSLELGSTPESRIEIAENTGTVADPVTGTWIVAEKVYWTYESTLSDDTYTLTT